MSKDSHTAMRKFNALLAGMGILDTPKKIQVRGRQDPCSCVQCGVKIPPGKAGRKCRECRKED